MAETIGLMTALNVVQVPLTLLASLQLTGDLWPPVVPVANNSCFDYIVVGVGTAGSIIANRLTENGTATVLGIEAGGDPPVQSLLPALFPTLPESQYDWDYYSTLDKYAASAQNNYTKLTAGKMVGGSSSLNHFVLTRGAPYDYDLWAELLNDNTWKYKNVLKYFKKYEELTDPVLLNSPFVKIHGTDGPVGIARQYYTSADDYLTSFGEVGNKVRFDLNGKNSLGYSQALFTISGGIRQSTAYAYIRPAKDRVNLTLLRNTMVIKVVFENNVAVGVIALNDNGLNVFRASKEVIISTGVFNTPKVLMLSGIGPSELLESFDIDVISNLPVGENYQDQVAVSIVHKMDVSADPTTLLPVANPTIIPFPVVTGLVATEKGQKHADYQTYSLILPHDSQFIDVICSVIYGYKATICDAINLAATGRNSLYTIPTLVNPKSRGSVKIQSTNPSDPPLITTGFLTNEEDLQQIAINIKDYIKVVNSSYFEFVNSEIIDPGLPECSDYIFGSDDYWLCYIPHMSISPYHSTSTSAMGQVVDSKFRVLGVERLRVVDASVLPQLPSAGPYAAVLMIGEKASDDIINDGLNNTSAECPTNVQKTSSSSLNILNLNIL